MKKHAGGYPSKTTINLVMREKTPLRLGISVPLTALVLVLVALFGKFAVADQLARVNEAQASLAVVRQQVESFQAATAEFDAVVAQYNRYASGWMTEEEKQLADRQLALSLVERKLMTRATVLDFSVAENVLSASMSGLSLDGTSQLVRELQADEQVLDVALYTASNDAKPGQDGQVSIVITLRPPQLAQTDGGEVSP